MFSLAILPIALAAVTPAISATAQDTRIDYEQWERRIRRRVAKLHLQPEGADRNRVAEVVVSFAIGEDGRPEQALIRNSSGELIYDRAALRLVRTLGPIGRVPNELGSNPRVQLRLTYGEAASHTADEELDRSLALERQQSSRRNLGIVAPTSASLLVDRNP